MEDASKRKGPRVIFFDLETLPNLPEALKIWPQLSDFPGRTLKASISTIICFGWKVQGEDKKPNIKSAWDYPKTWSKNVNDDKELCRFAAEVLMGADVVITQNGKAFDWKFLQSRLIYHGLPSLPKKQHIDTKLLVKSNLYLFSNSLKHMARFLTDDEKMENEGWDLWVKVHGRDPKAMSVMEKYCKQDVNVLEKIYNRLKCFAKEMPNLNLWRRDGVDGCPSCGGHNLIRRGEQISQSKITARYSCKDCGTWSSSDAKERLKRV